MGFRQMRVFIMFDLPTETVSDRSAYRHFRKLLINSGFIMMQESIYTKLCLNGSAAKCVIDNIKKNKPEKKKWETVTKTNPNEEDNDEGSVYDPVNPYGNGNFY